ncbi:MAG: hypothetical protein PUP92_38550 [Rhizonema sp. PD38]|nr:hypothetical protein [Rhizonema sp. PD38]
MLSKFPDDIAQYNKAVSFNRQFWLPVHKIGLILSQQDILKERSPQWLAAIAINKKAAEPVLAFFSGTVYSR